MFFLPRNEELQKVPARAMHQGNGIQTTEDPVQLNPDLLRRIRQKLPVRIDTDDRKLTAALLELDENDRIFTVL